MFDWRMAITDGLLALATLAMTVAVIGVIRRRNSYTKIHSAANVVVFSSMVLFTCALAGNWEIFFRAILVMVLMLVTSPMAAHALARLEAQLESHRMPREVDPGAPENGASPFADPGPIENSPSVDHELK